MRTFSHKNTCLRARRAVWGVTIATLILLGAYAGEALAFNASTAYAQDTSDAAFTLNAREASQDNTALASDSELLTFSTDFDFCQSEAREMIDMVNDFRQESGVWYWNEGDESKTYPSNLSRLQYDKDLEAVAMQRAAELVMSFSHTRPDGTLCFTAYPSGFYACGENIACGFTSAESVVEAWKETDYGYDGQGHRRNMLSSSFNCVGYACVEYEGMYYWVQEFGYRETPNTNIGSAVDSSAPVTLNIPYKYISSLQYKTSGQSCRLNAKGASKQLPVITGNVTTYGKTWSATFDLDWQCSNENQISIQNGKVTALVENNTSFIYAPFLGKYIWFGTRPQTNISRYWGDDYFGTNLKTLQADVAENGTPEGIIVCTDVDYVDSLSAAALSGLLDYPIVIVNGSESSLNDISKQSLNAVTNNGANKLDVIILGGNVAVTNGIEKQLTAYDSDGTCKRIWGTSGYDTNRAVYDYGTTIQDGWSTEEVLVATGQNYYDALGAGSYAAAKRAFVLLTGPNEKSSQLVQRAQNSEHATICGGSAVVSEQLEESLSEVMDVSRVWGESLYNTNTQFVKYAVAQGMSLQNAGVSTSVGYWDSLGSSHILGKSNSVMFLVNTDESDNQGMYGLLRDIQETVSDLRIFGGTAVVTESTEWSLTNG